MNLPILITANYDGILTYWNTSLNYWKESLLYKSK